ncbi:hypothetical protein [Corynebacterium sphenisci]|uniref:hypothetical protein n=1 Tax=Corynebacterium sphenisci TaxID=191493 RepID=UPI0026E0175A|nr:hypothetical protein [Corynebacterium sphenisci]MDO5731940.1 hypothetical protein [Corynebacterium sphenisci]
MIRSPHRPSPWRRPLALLAGLSLATGLLACGGPDDEGLTRTKTPDAPVAAATELEASETLLDSAELVVVSAMGPEVERRAAALAVAAGAPMLTLRSEADRRHMEQVREEGGRLWEIDDVAEARALAADQSYWGREATGSDAAGIAAELDRLGAGHVVTVGAVDLGAGAEGRTVVADPGDAEGFAEITGVEPAEPEGERNPARAIAELDRAHPTAPGIDPAPAGDPAPPAGDEPAEGADPATGAEAERARRTVAELPEMSGHGDPDAVVLAGPDAPLGAIATARAVGHEVLWLPAGDPRATDASVSAVREGRSVIALGASFGDAEQLATLTGLAADEDVEELGLAGGGQLLLPGRRMVAVYGHPGVPAMGVMGEETPAEAVKDAKTRAAAFAEHVEEPVVPMFEIIASVAQPVPGEDGTFSVPAPVSELEPYVDAITEAGGYAVLDLQPGNARFLDQAKFYEDLLARPNVGLALDAEWKMEPGQVPATEVGHVEAEEVNEVADWLASFTRERGLPQKMLMLHQFQLQMIRDREEVRTDHPELALVLHADGHGTPGQKFDTWNVMKQDLQPEIFLAWKNFIDEDQPMFDPAQTAAIEPTPWVVTYQ